ncbi:MAG: bifunctional nuclease family protein [Bacteroidetes bacterium]|nr:bifunctional nuclease family protein [Bacteroidota bacterium]MDA0874158.1 bifunctional nuclease family protein [Bacteroidota bacterium]
MDLIQVDIIGLSTSPSSGGAYALVLGEIDGNRRLPIIIGAFEAQAIALELEKIQPPRPMTHDLIRDLFDSVSADVTDILIDELREGTFFAKIRYTVGGNEAQLDCRPSDAVALAVRVGAPIFVAPSVLDEAGIPTEEEESSLSALEAAPETPVEEPAPETDKDMSPLEKLEEDLSRAIADEDYELAAKLRDDITRLKGEQN